MDHIIALLEETLNEKDCYDLARRHQFIQRSTSKLKGHEFIKAIILPSEGNEDSLNGFSERIQQFNPETNLSAQALSERINSEYSPRLMKEVFSIILAKSRSKTIEKDPNLKVLHKQFPEVIIEDSSVFKLHHTLSKIHKGTNRGGKSGMESQVKINLIYSVAYGRMIDASLHNGKDPDQGLAGRVLSFLKKGDLVIRDLGYFVLKVFKAIDDLGAFFLSRLQPNVKIFLNVCDTTPVDLGKYIRKHHRQANLIDINVFLGEDKIRTRLVMYKNPSNVTNMRLRMAHKRAKDTGRTLSKSKKTLSQYSAFVTNVSVAIFSAEFVGTVYRLRWDIELIFKQWKGQLKIHVLKGLNPNRIECLIWGRLCMTILAGMVCNFFAIIAYDCNVELSPVKLINHLIRGDRFFRAVAEGKIEVFFENIEKNLLRMFCKDKRRRKTMRGRIETKECYYGCAA